MPEEKSVFQNTVELSDASRYLSHCTPNVPGPVPKTGAVAYVFCTIESVDCHEGRTDRTSTLRALANAPPSVPPIMKKIETASATSGKTSGRLPSSVSEGAEYSPSPISSRSVSDVAGERLITDSTKSPSETRAISIQTSIEFATARMTSAPTPPKRSARPARRGSFRKRRVMRTPMTPRPKRNARSSYEPTMENEGDTVLGENRPTMRTSTWRATRMQKT